MENSWFVLSWLYPNNANGFLELRSGKIYYTDSDKSIAEAAKYVNAGPTKLPPFWSLMNNIYLWNMSQRDLFIRYMSSDNDSL